MTQRSVFREYLEALLIAGIFLGFTNTFLVKTFFIPSGSMEDTLLIGDHLFVNRFVYGLRATDREELLPQRSVRRGDVVIFRSPENPTTDLVKRCVALAGDTVEMVDKVLYVNGEAAAESAYVQHGDPQIFPDKPYLLRQVRRRDNMDELTVPEGHLFFLGDNRDFSYDSRYWGPVPAHFVKGRALVIYWSFGGQTPDGDWPGLKAKLAHLARTAGGFFTETRWSRTFHVVR
jgi:signal peptidase I